MSGWRPKTSKFGGLPNISFEPRTPVSLGIMLRNAVEGFSGILTFQDIVQDVYDQHIKKYMQEDSQSHLPMKEEVKVHVAEVLRRAEGASIVRGGLVCGDA